MNPDDFYRAAMRIQPVKVEQTPVQKAIGAALGEWLRLNAVIGALGSVPSAAATILAECETAMLASAAHFAEARRLVQAGEPIAPGETRG